MQKRNISTDFNYSQEGPDHARFYYFYVMALTHLEKKLTFRFVTETSLNVIWFCEGPQIVLPTISGVILVSLLFTLDRFHLSFCFHS